MSARLTDWSLALAVGLAFATGIISLVSGRPGQWLVFALHGAGGLWLLLLTCGKLRRVWPRLVHRHAWDRRTVFGLAATLLALLAGVSGVWWVAGGDLYAGGFNLLNWHIVLGLALTLFVSLHMIARAKPLRSRDVGNRRQALRWSGLLLGGAALWPVQQALGRALDLPGAQRRFTGSREADSFAGNEFPSTSWVADQPRPLDPATWRLQIGGAVARPLEFGYADLLRHADELEATLDCTGGFYSTQRWHGARIDRLLHAAGPHAEAHWVSFVSVTGYRWHIPIGEAANALLATHVGGEPLSHAHGAPARLVAPGHRGFEWVKWVTRMEVLTEPDPGAIASLYTSSFTVEGRGE
jgi:hypothetical protein